MAGLAKMLIERWRFGVIIDSILITESVAPAVDLDTRDDANAESRASGLRRAHARGCVMVGHRDRTQSGRRGRGGQRLRRPRGVVRRRGRVDVQIDHGDFRIVVSCQFSVLSTDN